MCALAACGCTRLKLPGSDLPTRSELGQITATPPAKVAPPDAGRRVTSWELAQPLASSVGVGPPRGSSAGERLLAQLSESSAGIAYDEALTCAAHQYARFMVRERDLPIQPLASFMYHRCGVVASELSIAYGISSAPPTLAQAGELVEEFARGGRRVGMWLESAGGQYLLLALAAKEQLRIEPLAMAPGGARVTLEGETSPREWMQAFVNHGELGVERCDLLVSAGQAFTLSCPLDPRDHETYVDILVARPRQLLGNHVARLWLSPDGSMPARYDSPVSSSSAAPLPRELGPSFVEMINVLRGRAGLSRLREVPAQSQLLGQLMPYYVDARARGDLQRLEDIVLGVMAGWEVAEPVLDSTFSGLRLESIRTRAELLETVLYQPYVRASVMQPGVDRIAVGLSAPVREGQQRDAAFATYRLAGDPREAARALVMRVDALRRYEGRPRLTALSQGPATLAAAAEEVRKGVEPRQALGRALASLAPSHPGKYLQGSVTLVQDISKLEIPPELLDDGELQIAVHVELLESEDSPWASLLVMIAYLAD